MSWSLRLHNGDFVLNGAKLGTVTDASKLTQDLRCALLTRMGTDSLHPTYGSLIDGGRTPDGTVAPSLVGMTNFQQVAATVHTEIQRIGSAYMAQQLNRAKADRTIYNRVSLSPGEVLLSITDIHMTQQEDTLLVAISLQTAQGASIDIALPIPTA